MKIKTIAIENVKSFHDQTLIEFDETLNVFVGPNGGGKSNLLDILTILIRGVLFKAFKITERSEGMRLFKDIEVQSVLSPSVQLDKFNGDNRESRIQIQLVISQRDVTNIVAIAQNKGPLEAELEKFRNKPVPNLGFLDQWNVEHLAPGTELNYTIVDGTLQTAALGVPERFFLEYVQNFELFLILDKGARLLDLRPSYLYFSPYRSASVEQLIVNLATENYYDVLLSYYAATSRSGVSLVKAAALYFGQRRRSYESSATGDGYLQRWEADPEVRLVTKYLGRLNYGWSFELLDEKKNIYRMNLQRDGRSFDFGQASGGEREIINFLLGMFAFNVLDGLIVIDEPEVHLHPKWQSTLVELFLDLANETGNQFVITTHSGVCVSPSTIDNVRRIYRDTTGNCRLKAAKSAKGFSPRDVLHIVNSHNNERMFFAEKVVLVEGVQDRLFFSRLLQLFSKLLGRTEVVEVLEVHGRASFNRYKKFLAEFGVDAFVIADLDFLVEIDDESIKACFVTDDAKIDQNVLKKRRSIDRKALAVALENAIREKNFDTLISIWEHIKNRHVALKEKLSAEERQSLDNFLTQQTEQGVFVLRMGELEDYLPDGYKQLDQTIEFVKGDIFSDWIASELETASVKEVVEIALKILAATEAERQGILQQMNVVSRRAANIV